MSLLHLLIAIISEVVAISALKATEGFTKWAPSFLVIAGYASAFYFLSLTLRVFPLGVVYSIWSGVGIALITLIGWILFKQVLDLPAFIGIGFIVTGVAIIFLFSKTVSK